MLPRRFLSMQKVLGALLALTSLFPLPSLLLALVLGEDTIAAFAKTSKPCEQWPAYTAAGDQLMEFGAAPGVRTGFKKSAFTAQETVGLPQLKLGE